MSRSNRQHRVRNAPPPRLFIVAVAAFMATGCAIGRPVPTARHHTVPRELTVALPSLQRTLLFDVPAYLSNDAEDTPYQRLRLCDAAGRSCRTLVDVRGAGGVSMPADKTLGLSPDGRYLLCFRMTGVDAAARSYRRQNYQLYDLVTSEPVTFNTDAGVTATTDNIQGWSADHPHALEISTVFGEASLAFPARAP